MEQELPIAFTAKGSRRLEHGLALAVITVIGLYGIASHYDWIATGAIIPIGFSCFFLLLFVQAWIGYFARFPRITISSHELSIHKLRFFWIVKDSLAWKAIQYYYTVDEISEGKQSNLLVVKLRNRKKEVQIDLTNLDHKPSEIMRNFEQLANVFGVPAINRSELS